ncbi:lipopolysaccharide biosynthesis protein [Hydrocarboniclastica marina]|nr:lipopolysaccharide biosynthesis protein [Hydrocarboniclastica marina]
MAIKNISTSVVKSSAWLGFANIVVNVLAFISTLILARLLTPDDFGLIALASTFVALAETFTSVQISSALINFKRVTNAHLNTAWTLGALRGLLLAIVIALLAFPLSALYEDGRLTGVMLILALITFFRCLTNPKYVFFEKELSYSREFVIMVVMKLLSVVAAGVLAYLYQTYWALIAGTAFAGLSRVILSYWFVPFLPRVSLSKVREIWAFTGWLTLGSALDAINSNIDTLIIGATLTASQLGAYRVGNDLAQKPTKEVLDPLRRPLFPAFALFSDDKEKLAVSYRRTQYLLFALVFPFGAGFSVIAEPMVNLVLGERWSEAIFVIEVLAINFALQSFVGPAISLAFATGKTKAVFTRQLIFFAVRVPIVVAALLLYGLPGLIVARFGTGLINIVLNLYMVNHIIQLSPFRQVSMCWRSLVSGLLMVFVVYQARETIHFDETVLEQSLGLLFFCLIGAIVYPATHLALWLLAGRPLGAETEILELARKILLRFKRA